MKRAISLLLMICLILTATPFGFDVFGVDYEIPGQYVGDDQLTASEIKAQIQDIYQKSKKSFGGSFSGYCGAYVGWQLYHMGINTSYVAPNGKDAWDTYKNMTTTSGGYTVDKYSATNSTLKQTLKSLAANGNVYNIMVCLQKGNTEPSATYGHVSFIHAIIDGVVYFSESGNMTLQDTYYPSGSVIAKPLDYVCDYIYTYNGFGYAPQVEGVIHFTGTGNPNSVSVSWSEDSANAWFGDTDAKLALTAKISGSNQSGITGDGIYLYDYAGNELASCNLEESTTLTNTTVPVFFTVSQRLQYTLSPGTQYRYKMYITINGKKHESPTYSFTTTGTHSHKNNAEWNFDETYHWQNCITCGAESGKASHNYSYGACNVCGQIEEIPTEEDFYTYTVTDGKATITDVSDSFGGYIIIPSTLGGYPVVAIAESAFANRNDISGITVPEGVTDIGDYAFYGCTNLQSVTIPDSVTYIGWAAFGDCEDLTSATFGYGIESLDYATFKNCISLQEIELPDSLTFLGDDVFNGCYNLTEVYMPENLTIIGDYAFYGCESLNEIYIPEEVTYIGECAFYESGLKIAEFENELGWCIEDLSLVFSYGDLYYEGVENKAAEYLSDDYAGYDWTRSDENIDDISYYMYEIIDGGADITGVHPSISGDVTIPSTFGGYPVVSIGYSAFWWCEKLESIIIPDSVVYISSFAFNNCQALKSIVLPKNLECIGLEVFSDCISLKSITIPAGVVTIGNWTFSGCENLENVYFENTEGWTVSLYGSGDIVEISSNDLANSKKAAEYLTDTHSNDGWTCAAVDCKHRVISDFWYSGLGFHWHECISCGESFDVERHNAVNGECTICGEEVQAIADIDSANATYGDTVIIEVELMDALKTDTLGFELELPQGITLVESENTCWMIDGELTAISTSPIRGVWANSEETDPNGTILSFEFKIEDDAFLGQNEIILEIYPDDTEEGKTSDAVIELGGIIYVNEYTLGDIDGAEGVDAKDAIYLLYNIFFGDGDYPVNQDCDFNGDNSVTSEDAIYLLYHVFFGDEAYPLF